MTLNSKVSSGATDEAPGQVSSRRSRSAIVSLVRGHGFATLSKHGSSGAGARMEFALKCEVADAIGFLRFDIGSRECRSTHRPVARS